jgi:hypothetical protein
VLEKVEKRYGLKLPRKVVTVDYGDDDKRGKVVAIEITNITTL